MHISILCHTMPHNVAYDCHVWLTGVQCKTDGPPSRPSRQTTPTWAYLWPPTYPPPHKLHCECWNSRLLIFNRIFAYSTVTLSDRQKYKIQIVICCTHSVVVTAIAATVAAVSVTAATAVTVVVTADVDSYKAMATILVMCQLECSLFECFAFPSRLIALPPHHFGTSTTDLSALVWLVCFSLRRSYNMSF